METNQVYTGTIDKANLGWFTFRLNMEGAQTTLSSGKYLLSKLTIEGPTTSGSFNTVYMNIFEVDLSNNSVGTYIGSSTNATQTAVNTPGTWKFRALPLETGKDYLFTFTMSPSDYGYSGFRATRMALYKLNSDTTHKSSGQTSFPSGSVLAYMPDMTLTFTDEPSDGKITIKKGYYTNGTTEIVSSDMTKTLYQLKAGQTISWKNNLFMTTYNGTATPYMSSLNAPTGTFDAYVNLNHPVYMDYTKTYLIGDKPADHVLNTIPFIFNKLYSKSGATDNRGIVQITSSTGYINYQSVALYLTSARTSFEFKMKIKTTNDVSTQQTLIHARQYGMMCYIENGKFVYLASSNNTNWDILTASTGVGTYTIQPNTEYWLKIGWTGSSYYLQYSTDGTNYTTDISVSSSVKILESTSFSIYLGCTYFTNPKVNQFYGLIDMNEFSVGYNNTSSPYQAITRLPAEATTAGVIDRNTTYNRNIFVYDDVGGYTYWYPAAITKAINSIPVSAANSGRISVYLTNKNGSSDIYISNNAPTGVDTYYKTDEYVYITNNKAEILGAGKNPQEVVLLYSGTKIGGYFWTYLESSIYLDGVDTEVSDLSTESGVSKTGTMYICGKNTSNELMSSIVAAGTETAYDTPYLGYTLVFTDNTYSGISSLTKTGKRCKIYRGAIDSSNDYIIAMSLEDDETIYYTTFDHSKTTRLPINISNSSTTFDYSSVNDTITYNSVVCSYVGEYYANIG